MTRHLRVVGQPPAPASVPWSGEPWVTKRQLAEHLGFTVRWVEYRMADGMPHRRIGGRARFRRSEVEAWLEQRDGGTLAA